MTKSKASSSFDPAAHLAKQGWKGKGTGGSGPGRSSSLIHSGLLEYDATLYVGLTLVQL